MKSKINKELVMKKGKKPTTTPESFTIDDDHHLVMYLYDAGFKKSKYVRVDFNDYTNYEEFCMIMDKKTLKGMADCIYKYLKNNK